MSLVLSRRLEEEVIINGNIRVRVISHDRGKFRIAIDAPRDVSVDRAEIHEQREQWRRERLPAIDEENRVDAILVNHPDLNEILHGTETSGPPFGHEIGGEGGSA